jgi:hypothetical protein
MHGVNDTQIIQPAMRNFDIIQKFWNYAGGMSLRGNNRIGYFPHQARFTATIDKAKIARSQYLAQLIRSRDEPGVGSCCGPGENA